LLVARAANAESAAPGYSPPAPAAAPTAASEPSSLPHRHDGFYLRLGLGGGLSLVHLANRTTDESDQSWGGGFGWDFAIGGSPSPGFVFGGAYLGSVFFMKRAIAEQGPGSQSSSVGVGLMGPMCEIFPDPEGGLSVGGAAGLGFGTVVPPNHQTGELGAGLGLAAWVGHGAWVSDEWSLGGRLVLGASSLDAKVRSTDSKLQMRSGSLSLVATAIYN